MNDTSDRLELNPISVAILNHFNKYGLNLEQLNPSMAIYLLSPTPSPTPSPSPFFISSKQNPSFLPIFPSISRSTHIKATTNPYNGVPETPKRRGRPKGSKKSSTLKSPKTTEKPNEPSQNTQFGNGSTLTLDKVEDFDDGMDFPYLDPPLICCFGAVQKEFVPTVRVSEHQMHPDIYSEWKMMQWNPPEFGRAPGGPSSNVAISHVRLGGRAAFIGKVGDDDFGEELVYMMNKEKVQTRGVKFDSNVKTACTFMKIKFCDDGKMKMETVKEAAEDSLDASELSLAVLKEV